MLGPRRGLPRLIRALVLTAVVLGLASAAHVLGGAALPSGQSLGWLALVVLPFALVGTAVRLRAVPTALGLVLGQAAGHLGFAALESAAQAGPAACESGHALHSGGLAAVAPGCLTAGAAAHPAAHSLLPSPGMLLAHLLAAVVSGWLLARGEDVLWRVVGWLVRPVGSVEIPVCRATRGLTPAPVPVPAPVHGARRGRAPPAPLR